MAACNDLTKREAQLLIKRKFPPRPSGCDEAVVAGAQRRRGPTGDIFGADAPRLARRD